MEPAELYYSLSAVERFKQVEERERRKALYYAYNKGYLALSEIDTFNASPASQETLQSPLFGAWLDRILQAEQTSGLPKEQARALATQRARYIGNYAIMNALRSGQALETMAAAHEGFVMVPELGRIALRGVDAGLVRVTLDDTLTVFGDGAQTRLPLDALGPDESPHWQPLRRIGPPSFNVALNDIDPNRLDIYRYPVSPRLSEGEYQLWADMFTQAWDFLQQHDPHLASLVSAHLTTIIPAPAESLAHPKTMAAGATIGAISFNENRDPIRLASQIAYGIRKDMALALRAEMPYIYPEEHMHDPVYPPSREGYGIAAHLQDDAFVNVGLARFYHSLLMRGSPALRDYYGLSFARWYMEARQNIAAWRKSGYAQRNNGGVRNALGWELYELQGTFESLPDALKQAVATNSQDKYISWRLHTVLADPDAVAYLRHLWLGQRPCPHIEVPGSLSQSNEAYVNVGQRTRYVVLAELPRKEPALFAGIQQGRYDPSLFGNLTAGDIALAKGDYSAAREYYSQKVRQQPSNPEAWAGFAYTFEHEQSAAAQVLGRQPELVAALYAAIGDSSLNPAAVAAWLEPCTVSQICVGA